MTIENLRKLHKHYTETGQDQNRIDIENTKTWEKEGPGEEAPKEKEKSKKYK